jgi:hypothetical protein
MDVMSRIFPRPVLLVGLLTPLMILTACGGDSPAAPDPSPQDGQARFTFAGSGFDGNFEAAGIFERDEAGLIKLQSFATAVDVTVPQYNLAYFGIVAANFYPPVLDDLSILLSAQEEGEYAVTTVDECLAMMELGAGPCAAVSFDFGINIDGSNSPDGASFELVNGNVVVNSIAGSRIRGTFNGAARQFGDWRTGEYYASGIEVELANGTFDVPVILLRDWNGTAQLNPDIEAPLRARMRP